MKLLAKSIAALCLFLPAVALADEPDTRSTTPPPTGTGLIVTGSIFTALGVVNLATSPVCMTGAIPKDTQKVCLGASLAAGGVFLVVGIPLLAVGASRRSQFKEWQQKTGMTAGFVPQAGGGTATWQVAF